MCFMAINELDEVNSNLSDEEIHDTFEELYEDFETSTTHRCSLPVSHQPAGPCAFPPPVALTSIRYLTLSIIPTPAVVTITCPAPQVIHDLLILMTPMFRRSVLDVTDRPPPDRRGK